MNDDSDLTPATLRRAQEEFRQLLTDNAAEADWQAFFTRHPYVFSRSLPLRISPREIIPIARQGKSDPDFIFYQRSQNIVSGYGVIELKRPDSRILTLPRKDIILLTREADTAIKQAQHYAASIVLPEQVLFLGNSLHLFVVMGLTGHLASTLASQVRRSQLSRLVPTGCEILPYDELLRRFETTVPERLIALVPDGATVTNSDQHRGATWIDEALEQRGGWWQPSGKLTLIEFAEKVAITTARRMGSGRRWSIDPEAIAHDGVLKYFQHRHRLVGGNQKGWLITVIRHALWDAARRAEQEVSLEEGMSH